MLKILRVRLQQYMNWEFPYVQVGFIKGTGTRDETAKIHWIMEKAGEFQKKKKKENKQTKKSIYFFIIDYAKAFDCVDHNKLENT